MFSYILYEYWVIVNHEFLNNVKELSETVSNIKLTKNEQGKQILKALCTL